MTDGFIPRHQRTAQEQVDAFKAALGAALEGIEDAHTLFAGTVETLCELHARAIIAERAAETLMDALVGFEARCQCGDVDGAVMQLRAWLERLGA